MKNYNSFFTRKLGKRKARKIKIIISLFFVFLFLTNFFAFLNFSGSGNNFPSTTNSDYDKGSTFFGSDKPSVSTYDNNISLFDAPYNYTKVWDFFENNYGNNTAMDLPFTSYYREGDSEGSILEKLIYSQDQLFIYKTLLREELTDQDFFERYLDLENSPLWFNGSADYSYGFMRSYNTSSRQVQDDKRYLTDNLMAIFALLGKIGDNIDQITINGTQPVDSVEKMFELINSTQFYDDVNMGFFPDNSTTSTKEVESNLWTILSLLEISENTDISTTIRNRASDLANETLNTLFDQNIWDSTNLGFYDSSSETWTVSDTAKYLKVNALGILGLIECWNTLNNNTCLEFAENLFDKINDTMWNSTHNGFIFKSSEDFNTVLNDKIDLEANALMMQAGLELFDATGNFTYYNKSIQLFETFESTKFYNESLGAYNSTFNPFDGNKNLFYNLRVSETYIRALEIYAKSSLTASFNKAGTNPDYVFKQDTLNFTSEYIFESTNAGYNISKANLTYIIRFPNGTIFKIYENTTSEDGTHSIEIPINASLPLGQNYSISILVNRSYFKTRNIVRYFNVISAIGSNRVLELDGFPTIFQGQSLNVTLPVTSERNSDTSLIVSIEGSGVVNRQKNVLIQAGDITNVSMLLTIETDTPPGFTLFNFIVADNAGNLYHSKLESITVENALQLSNFAFNNKATIGSSIQVSFDMKNFLPENQQNLTVSFIGEPIQDFNKTVLLEANEKKTVNNLIEILSAPENEDSIQFKIFVKRAGSNVYNKTFTINILSDFEVLSFNLPNKVAQGDTASLIINVMNNRQSAENFSLYINGQKVSTNIDEFLPGENKIIKELIPTINPYNLGTVPYEIVLKDASGDIIISQHYEVKIELSPFNLVTFYILPFSIPIGIILYYKHKDLKNMMLRR
jgi:hypothetical protein